jgi:hypothetical protein
MLTRNPGVALVWTTRRYGLKHDPGGGMLFDIGDPESVSWWCEGRAATREEVQHSIDTGLPALEEIAAEHGELAALAREVKRAEALLPT